MFIVKVSYFSISRINNCQEIRENGGFFDCWGGGRGVRGWSHHWAIIISSILWVYSLLVCIMQVFEFIILFYLYNSFLSLFVL